MPSAHTRRATHAGSWYNGNGAQLREELKRHISKANPIKDVNAHIKAIICPHAGYAYCGPTAGWSWRLVNPQNINRVIVLGPSHHKYLRTCALPHKSLTTYQTPLGDIRLDIELLSELRSFTEFDVFTLDDDEREHSIELQLPFLKYSMSNEDFSLVPIVVGDMSMEKFKHFASILLPYFKEKDTLLIISSDFCHWGKKFRYQYIHPTCQHLPIHEAIKKLDMDAIKILEKLDLDAFLKYLEGTGNTICGQNPIKLLLVLLNEVGVIHFNSQFLHYSQSTQATSHHETSVSYASLAITQ